MTWHAWSGCTKPPKTGPGAVQCCAVVSVPWYPRAVVKFSRRNVYSAPEQAHRHQAPLTHIPYEFLYAGTSYTYTYVPTQRNSAHSKSDAAWNGRPVHIEPKLFDL